MTKTIKEVDALVIGGGAVGTSAAYHLAKMGKKVVLCEKRNIGSGASGRCGGMVVHCYGREVNIELTDFRLMFTRANTALMKEYQKTFEIDFELNLCGCLDIAINEEEFDTLKELIKIQRSLGDNEIQLLDKQQTLEVMPNLNPNLIFGSRLRPSDGNLNPILFTLAQAYEAQKLGAEIMTNTKVDELVIKNNVIQGVRIKDHIIEARDVIIATNAWVPTLVEGTEVIPIRELAMVTERLPKLPPQPFEMLCGGDFAYGATQTASGNYNLGGPGPARCPGYDYFDETIYADEVLRVMSYITVIFPSLKNVSIIRSWVGTYAFTPDGLPSIGPMPGIKGLFLAVGYPDGMAWGAISGKLAAEYTCNKKTSLPIEKLNPGRFIGKEKIKWPVPHDLTVCHEFLGKKGGYNEN
jgi:glycine/D-amino acid oxidase-like deaminating enzyme